MNRKPMLAVDSGGVDEVVIPVYASTKLDGLRCIIGDGVALSRALKPIPNRRVQALLAGLPEGLDGELIAGDPTAEGVFRRTESMVMSEDAPIDGLLFHVFDIQEAGTFEERYAHLHRIFGVFFEEMRPGVCMVEQVYITSRDQLRELEELWVVEGYEGTIVRKPGSPYKNGRSTLKEGFLLKLKRFIDGEAEVVGVEEQMHNGNEAKTNELGRTHRSSHKANKTPMGVMGKLLARDLKSGVVFKIGTGFSKKDRKEMWDAPPIGKLAKYKFQAYGVKDKPRSPVFLGWRDARDL